MPSNASPPPGSKTRAAGLSADALADVLDDALAFAPAEPPPEPLPVSDLLEAIGRRVLDLAEAPAAPEDDEDDVLVLDDSWIETALRPAAESGTDADVLVLDDSIVETADEPVAKPAAAAEDDDVLVLDDSMVEVEPEPVAEPVDAAEDDDVLVLDDSMVEAEPEPVAAEDDDVLVLGDSLAEATPEPLLEPLVAPVEPDALAILLADPPPSNDFAALDLLYGLWPRGSRNQTDADLLAVAQNLARRFGCPDHLPMTAARAWQMLDPQHFQAAFATQLTAIGAFARDWQDTHRDFLILEFGEVELIEYLFEGLHPGHHAELLVEVMNFKVLSNRRLGLLRRVPNRMRKAVEPLLTAGRPEEAMVELAHAKALLDRIADPLGYAPIVESATRAADEVEKLMKRIAAAAAPATPPAPPAGGGLTLGRIG